MVDIKKQIIEPAYRNSVSNWESWKSDGKKNEYVAKILYRRYNSFFKRLGKWNLQQADPSVIKDIKFRLNTWDEDLGRFALMFFGVALECYLKAFLIKNGGINPLNKTGDGLNLGKKGLNHCIVGYSKRVFDKKLGAEDYKVLESVEEAIKSGKYHVCSDINSQLITTDLDLNVKIVKNVITKIKKKLEDS